MNRETAGLMMNTNYPADVTDNDPYFNDGESFSSYEGKLPPPKTTMVWCVECQKHWKAPAEKDYWKARTEPCPKHNKKTEAA